MAPADAVASRTLRGFVWSPRTLPPPPPPGEDYWCVRDAVSALMLWEPGSTEWARFIDAPAPEDMDRLAAHLGLESYDPEFPAHIPLLEERRDHPGLALWALHGVRMSHVVYQPTLRKHPKIPTAYWSYNPELFRIIVDTRQPPHV